MPGKAIPAAERRVLDVSWSFVFGSVAIVLCAAALAFTSLTGIATSSIGQGFLAMGALILEAQSVAIVEPVTGEAKRCGA